MCEAANIHPVVTVNNHETPEDMADFDFVLQWRELRDEVTSSLRRHYEAATRAFAAAPGTHEHHEASVAAQRTRGSTLVPPAGECGEV